MEAQLQETINKIDHLIGLSKQLLITRHQLRPAGKPSANSGAAAVACEVAANATAEPTAASGHRDPMMSFNGLHFWLAFLGFFAMSAMLVASLVR